MKEPVDHIVRPSLPWRAAESGITECGYDASKVKTITRETLVARFKDYGKERTWMLTCMTCIQTAERWSDWHTDPRLAMGREVELETRRYGTERPGPDMLLRELIAIQRLIEIHRSEFDALLAEDADRRAWLARKDEHARVKKQARRRTSRW